MQTRPNLMRGAMHLAGAGLIVKAIGACFKIPLGALLKPEGTAIFSVAYQLYAFLFSLATAGVPVAVSKLVAESTAHGKAEDASNVANTARVIFGGIGLCFSLILFFGAEQCSKALGVPSARLAIRAIAPSVFFVSLLSADRGYFQGLGDMIPTATSEIIEAAGKLLLGLSLAWWFARNGFSRDVQAAGAIGGVTLGCLFSVVYLSFVRRDFRVPLGRNPRIKPLLSHVVPITLSASLIGLVGLIDSTVIMKTLQSVGVSETRAMWMFGTYTYASNLFGLPNTLVTALAVSLIPTVAADRACGENGQSAICDALGIGLLIALSGATGLGVLAKPILSLLYGSGVEAEVLCLAGNLLVILCFGIPFLALSTVTNAIHQASGRVNLPMLSILLGGAVKLTTNCILLRLPNVQIMGAAVGTVLCYAIIAGIGWMALKPRPSLIRMSGKPVLVATATGVTAKVMFDVFTCMMPERMAVILAIGVGAIVFLFASKAVKIPMFPKK